MLSIFEVDEYAQYPHILRMLTPGDTLYQSLRNFLLYLHYYYGYPFYFLSAVSILPIKWISGSDWALQTPLIVLVLRQMLSVLPALLAVGVLTYCQTGFRSLWRSLLLFLFLLIIPGMVSNNLWWHPDALALLFVALTFFFLQRDDMRFGRNFLLAAAACGLAVSAKHQGLFFYLAVPVYIIWGAVGRRLIWWKVPLMGLIFMAVMAGAVLLTNPLLLLPQERAEILATQVNNLQTLASGFVFKNAQPYFAWNRYPDDFRIHYGELAFILLALVALVLGMRNPRTRVLNVMILLWTIPLIYSINFAATRRTHYFLPVILPLFSSLHSLFPERWRLDNPLENGLIRSERARRGLILAALAGMLIQAIIFSNADIQMVTRYLYREQTSPSLAFYENLSSKILKSFEEDRLVIYRDWHMYVPPGHPGWRVEMNWELASYELMADLVPDVILLERANLEMVTQPGALEEAARPDDMGAWQRFYGDASADKLPGYEMVYSDHFGLAFLRSDLEHRLLP